MSQLDSLPAILTLGILAVTVTFLVMGRYRSDLVSLCGLLALVLCGVLTPQEAFSGFSNAVIFVAAGMFIISGAIVRTGLASIASGRILGVVGKNVAVLYMTVMFLAAVIGSMVSNTGTVAIMMPIVVSMARNIDESPSRFLMPLAFMSSIGGMFTLIGNSPNMVAADAYAKAGYPALTLFSFFPVGLACFAFGMLILAPATMRYLSRRKNAKEESGDGGVSPRALADKYHLAENMYKLTVPQQSPLVGRTLVDLALPQRTGVVVQEVCRAKNPTGYGFSAGEPPVAPGPGTVIRPGDVLRVLGSRENITSMIESCGVRLAQPDGVTDSRDKFRFVSIGICELVLMSASRMVGRNVGDSGLREHFGITVLGIQRGDKYILDNIKDQVMQSGDALLVQGTWDCLDRLEEYSTNWVVVGRTRDRARSRRIYSKMPLVSIVLVLMVAAMAFNLVPTVAAVLLAALALIAGGCFKNTDEAYQAISWEPLVMIACLLPIALAMEKTGIVGVVSENMAAICARYGPHAAMAAIYGAASFMNIFMSTTPVAVLISPVAVQIAQDLGYSPLPFLFAAATGASMCFASPFSTPSNALVMSAGRYTFLDYMKIGLPMQALMGVFMVFALPALFPFAPTI